MHRDELSASPGRQPSPPPVPFPLLDLEDALVELIIDYASNRGRLQLRCVNRRLRDLVDERLTVMDLRTGGSTGDLNWRALRSWGRFPNVYKVFLGDLEDGMFKKLLTGDWPHLEEVEFEFSYFNGDKLSISDSQSDPDASSDDEDVDLTLASVRRVRVDAEQDLGDYTLRTLGERFPSLDSLTITGSLEYVDENLIYGPYEEQPHWSRSEKWRELSGLRRITLQSCMTSLHSLYEDFVIDWHSLEELNLTGCPAHCVSMFFKKGATTSWPNLKRLILDQCITSVEDLEAIFDADLPNLEVAGLYSEDEDMPVGAVLRRLEEWPKLKSLTLGTLLWEAPGELERFMEATLPCLESVDAFFSSDLIPVLAANARSWPNLRSLKRFYSPSADDLRTLLTDSPWSLEHLDISARGDALSLLAMLPEAAPATLRTLHLDSNSVEVPTQTLTQPWAALEELTYEGSSYSYEKGLRESAALGAGNRLGCLTKLRKLDLWSDAYSSIYFTQLCAAPFEDLTELKLRGRNLSSSGGALAQHAVSFPKITTLSITNISPAQLEQLLNAPWPESLEKVNLETIGRSSERMTLAKWSTVDAPRWEAVFKGSYDKVVSYLRPKY